MLDGCRRHAYDADLATFLDVISHRVPAAAHASQTQVQETLQRAFASADRQASGGMVSGTLKKGLVGGVVKVVFPHIADGELRSLLHSLERDVPGGGGEKPVRYAELFVEDKDCNQSNFVEGCRALCLRAPREYVGQIETALREADVSGTGVVTWAGACAAVAVVDPTIPPPTAANLANDGFGEASTDAAVDIRAFCRRLLYAYPKRYGPPPKPVGLPGGGGPKAGGRRKSASSAKGQGPPGGSNPSPANARRPSVRA